eukprot:79234-Rhodomonas_salina.1
MVQAGERQLSGVEVGGHLERGPEPALALVLLGLQHLLRRLKLLGGVREDARHVLPLACP